jgi:hypothetical protein
MKVDKGIKGMNKKIIGNIKRCVWLNLNILLLQCVLTICPHVPLYWHCIVEVV